MNRRLYKGLCALVIAASPALAALAGCSDLGEPLKLLPRAEVSPTVVDFGTVAVSASATRNVTVGNSGSGALNGFASVGCPVYSIQSGGGSFTVPPGGRHTVVVVYTPTATGGSPCELQLGSDIPPVDLNGEGALQAPGAQCVLSDTSLDFGTAAVGGSQQAGFTITNPGTAPLLLNVVPTCTDYAVVTGGGRSTLDPGGSLPVRVQFVPQAGGQISCFIAVGPGCPEVAVHGFATSVSFAADIQPLMNQYGCVSCHGWTQTSQFVNRRSQFNYPLPALIVKPFDLNLSILYGKITNSGQYGNSMPQGAALMPPPARDKFRRWILEGALDN